MPSEKGWLEAFLINFYILFKYVLVPDAANLKSTSHTNNGVEFLWEWCDAAIQFWELLLNFDIFRQQKVGVSFLIVWEVHTQHAPFVGFEGLDHRFAEYAIASEDESWFV